MSDAENKNETGGEKPKESKEEKKERLKKEKAEQKKEREKDKEPKADSKAEQKPDIKLDPKADKKAKPKAKGEAKAKPKPDSRPEQNAKPADKAAIGTAEGHGGAPEGESAEAGGVTAAEGEGGQDGSQEGEPAAVAPEPPPKKPLPRKLLYGLITIVFGVSIFLYTPLELFKIPDVLWFVPFVAVVMGLLKIWKKGLFDGWGQALVIGGILSHFAMLVWTDGSEWVPRITIPLMIVWAGFLVFAKGFQTWLKNRRPEEPIIVPEVPVKERKRWTYEDMAEVLAEVGELPDPDISGEPAATEIPGESGSAGAPDGPAANADPADPHGAKEKQK